MAAVSSLVKETIIGPLGIVAPPPLTIECQAFSGSLAALFQCVRQGKTDLLDIPLYPVCEAYFLYLVDSSGCDLDSAAAALIALAYLLERKAWALLPSAEPEPEVELPNELPIASAAEYQVAIEALRIWHDERERKFFRAPESNDGYEMPFEVGEVSSSDLARVLERLLAKAKPDPIVPLSPTRRSLSEQMAAVLRQLTKDWASIERLLPIEFTRSDVVWVFLALLELIRLGQASVAHREGDILFARGGAR